MNDRQTWTTAVNRRTFVTRSALGLGAVALRSLLDPSLLGADTRAQRWAGVVRPRHQPRAKRVIWLTMAGGPSHLETFDYKPKLAEMDGQPMPESLTRGQQLAQLQGQALLC